MEVEDDFEPIQQQDLPADPSNWPLFSLETLIESGLICNWLNSRPSESQLIISYVSKRLSSLVLFRDFSSPCETLVPFFTQLLNFSKQVFQDIANLFFNEGKTNFSILLRFIARLNTSVLSKNLGVLQNLLMRFIRSYEGFPSDEMMNDMAKIFHLFKNSSSVPNQILIFLAKGARSLSSACKAKALECFLQLPDNQLKDLLVLMMSKEVFGKSLFNEEEKTKLTLTGCLLPALADDLPFVRRLGLVLIHRFINCELSEVQLVQVRKTLFLFMNDEDKRTRAFGLCLDRICSKLGSFDQALLIRRLPHLSYLSKDFFTVRPILKILDELKINSEENLKTILFVARSANQDIHYSARRLTCIFRHQKNEVEIHASNFFTLMAGMFLADRKNIDKENFPEAILFRFLLQKEHLAYRVYQLYSSETILNFNLKLSRFLKTNAFREKVTLRVEMEYKHFIHRCLIQPKNKFMKTAQISINHLGELYLLCKNTINTMRNGVVDAFMMRWRFLVMLRTLASDFKIKNLEVQKMIEEIYNCFSSLIFSFKTSKIGLEQSKENFRKYFPDSEYPISSTSVVLNSYDLLRELEVKYKTSRLSKTKTCPNFLYSSVPNPIEMVLELHREMEPSSFVITDSISMKNFNFSIGERLEENTWQIFVEFITLKQVGSVNYSIGLRRKGKLAVFCSELVSLSFEIF